MEPKVGMPGVEYDISGLIRLILLGCHRRAMLGKIAVSLCPVLLTRLDGRGP